jgi:hypothetical protein
MRIVLKKTLFFNSFHIWLTLFLYKTTSVNPVHNAPVPPSPPAVTYFGPEATSPLAGCCEWSPELLARRHPKKKR